MKRQAAIRNKPDVQKALEHLTSEAEEWYRLSQSARRDETESMCRHHTRELARAVLGDVREIGRLSDEYGRIVAGAEKQVEQIEHEIRRAAEEDELPEVRLHVCTWRVGIRTDSVGVNAADSGSSGGPT